MKSLKLLVIPAAFAALSMTMSTTALADGADLLIMECYAHGKSVRYHLNYPDIVTNRDSLNAKRIVLTHMGPDMLAAIGDIPEETAFDGMVITP